ncbi:WcaF family extracellular polysaccharide biosynthesis acetyltransferase [Gillisia sp. JM1]|uniref:WcaF family extracellular polysaccharide biosynthesis acetyltransferase n=1 Tax=Gillisia sp. JM1 TaxID=1283286 RepID=UPI000411CA52|nr:WcaF family extracellular polysaccharide biosynthesis acetyltransferase [Gillisia sp. JM1]
MPTDLRSFNNKWYKPASRSKILLWYFINSSIFNTALPFPSVLKTKLLKIFGAKVGKRVLIKPKVNIKYPWLLLIGNEVWIGENVWIDNLQKVNIGNNVCISQGAMLLTGNHNYKKASFDLILAEINLKEGCWVGAKSIVCPGVTMNSHSVLSVGSIATQELKAYTIYQGNPATVVRERKFDL